MRSLVAIFLAFAVISGTLGSLLPGRPQYSRSNSNCICPAVYDPVCGSDGRDYSNPCQLRCEAVKIEVTIIIEIAYKGVCKGANKPKPGPHIDCICPTVYDPVCGTDRKTYPSLCELECEAVLKPKLYASYKGKCRHGVVVIPHFPGKK